MCGCLKDFLRGLSEPLVTFALHESFMVSAGELVSFIILPFFNHLFVSCFVVVTFDIFKSLFLKEELKTGISNEFLTNNRVYSSSLLTDEPILYF